MSCLTFNISLNDLFYCLDGVCNFDMYADDNTLSEEDMQVNADKFQDGLLSRDAQITSITLNINDIVLTNTALAKLLGVKIDNKLTFHLHIC